MTADGSNAPAGPESQLSREIPLRKMWLFAPFGLAGAIAGAVIAPNPERWIFLWVFFASLSVLVWLTRVELRRRKPAEQSDERR